MTVSKVYVEWSRGPARIGNYSFGIGRLVGDLVEGYVLSFEDWEMGSDKAKYV